MSLIQPFAIEKLCYRHHAQVNIVRGARACGKTWSVTHAIDKMPGMAALIQRASQPLCNPFYWDNTVRIERTWGVLYRNKVMKARFLPLAQCRANRKGEVLYSPYDALDFTGYTSILFDDCDSRFARQYDFKRFLHYVRIVVRCSPECKIFITIPSQDTRNDIALGFGITPEIEESLAPGDSICIHNPSGLKVAYQYYA